MSKEAAVAMWFEANVSMTVARIILQHLSAAFGYSIQVPDKVLSSFTEDVLEIVRPQFGSFLYCKDKDHIMLIKTKINLKEFIGKCLIALFQLLKVSNKSF